MEYVYMFMHAVEYLFMADVKNASINTFFKKHVNLVQMDALLVIHNIIVLVV